MEESASSSPTLQDRVLFTCWLPRAELVELKEGSLLRLSLVCHPAHAYAPPCADLVRLGLSTEVPPVSTAETQSQQRWNFWVERVDRQERQLGTIITLLEQILHYVANPSGKT